MLSPERRERVKGLDELLRAAEGLKLRDAAKQFGVTEVTIKADIDRLGAMISPVAMTGGRKSLTYRYADPTPKFTFEQCEAMADEARSDIARNAARLVALQEIRRLFSAMRKTDSEGPGWVLDQLSGE